MASARALHLPSVVSRVFQMEVTNRVSGMRWNDSGYECEMREVEVQSLYSSEVHGMCVIELALLEESSRMRQIQVEFNIQNAETYMTQGT